MKSSSLLKKFILEALATSALNLKPGMKLRHTGEFDPSMPAIGKVLSVKGDQITIGDNRGQTYQLTTKDLHTGGWQIMEMKLGVSGGGLSKKNSFDVLGDDVVDDEDDVTCPECGGPPGQHSEGCPLGDQNEPDPDRYRY